MFKGPTLKQTCFNDMLSVRRHVESNKESEKHTQQAKEVMSKGSGHKKESRSIRISSGIKKHYNKSKSSTNMKEATTTTANQQLAVPRKPFFFFFFFFL